MAKLLNISIDVTKIDKSKLVTGKKGTYLNLTVSVNDEKDNYDNDVTAWQGQDKEEVQAKAAKNYLGNGRVFWTNDTAIKEAAEKIEKVFPASDEQEDDLPF